MFAPGFVNYKKGALDSQPQVIKFTSCLPMVGGSLRLPPPLKLVAMTIAEILLKVALKHKKSNHLLYNLYYRVYIYCTILVLYIYCTILVLYIHLHVLYNSSTIHLLYNSSTIHLLYNYSTMHLLYNSSIIILSHFLDTKDLL